MLNRKYAGAARVTCDVNWYENKARWNGLVCFGAVTRTCHEKRHDSEETRYYISSKPLSPHDLLKYSRNEWGVESMHWMLDVIFDEDRTLLLQANAQLVLNILRKTDLNLVKTFKKRTSSNKSLVAIMRDNLFDPDTIPTFFRSIDLPN